MRTFGQFIREKRRAARLSITNFRLAEGHMSRIENEIRSPNLDTLLIIAEGFGIPLWKLFREFSLK